jgi:hypothetical protein
MARGCWKITGYDKLTRLFERRVSSALCEREIKQMLSRLAARELTDDEIVSASLRKGMKGRRTDLDVVKSATPGEGFWTTGSPRHYTARCENLE